MFLKVVFLCDKVVAMVTISQETMHFLLLSVLFFHICNTENLLILLLINNQKLWGLHARFLIKQDIRCYFGTQAPSRIALFWILEMIL